ncbi:rps1A, partial [Mucuna pruriens]
MTLILCPCKSLCFPKCSLPLNHISSTLKNKPHANPVKLPSPTPPKFSPFTTKFAILGATHVPFCSRNGEFVVDDGIQEHETLELLDKPSLVPIKNGSSSEIDVHTEKDSTEEEALALAPFLKLLKGSSSDAVVEEKEDGGGVLEGSMGSDDVGDESGEAEKVGDEYYEPKPGDFVVGNENKLNVNVGSELPGTMLTKELLPLHSKEIEHLLYDVNKAEESFIAQGRMGILKNDDAINWGPVPGGTVVEIGTILFAEVLGRTLAGRPLLSTRRLFRRIAWHRLRQIKQLGEPIQVIITEWNTKGLLTRIEGLRAFLPKGELVERVNSFTDLKENVGRRMHVQITQVDEAKNNLVLSEREAWEKLYLQEGTLLEGTVKKILPYGAQIRIGETNRGCLHASNLPALMLTLVKKRKVNAS